MDPLLSSAIAGPEGSGHEAFPSEQVYVDLDALLDTRLGTLAILDQNKAVEALKGQYTRRLVDAFPGVSRHDFRQAYAKRNIDTLKASFASNVFMILNACVKGSLEDLAIGGQNNGVKFVVNYHPYQLDEDVLEAMKEMIAHRTGNVMDVEMVSLSNEQLTPSFCHDQYALMIRYDYVEWYEMHLQALQDKPVPELHVVAPAMYYNEVPDQQTLNDFKRKHIQPFKVTEMASAALLQLRLLSSDVFSIDLALAGIKPKEPKSPGLAEVNSGSLPANLAAS